MWKTSVDGMLAITQKELVHLRRNKRSLKMLILMQVLEFGMMGWIDLTVRELPTVIVDQDRTTESRELIQRIAATKTLTPKFETSSLDQARGHIRAGRAKVAVVVPPNYARLRASGVKADILTLVDGSDSQSSGQAAAAVDGVVTRMNLTAQQELVTTAPRVTSHSVLLFNPTGRTSSFMLPGLLAILLVETYASFSMMSLAKERDAGNLERLLMTPMNYTSLILGKLLPWFVMGVFNAVVYLATSHFLLEVPVRGSVFLLLVAMNLYLLTAVALGSFVASGSKSAQDAHGKLFYYFFPVLWLSGYIFPVSSLPKVFLPVSYALPQTHFIEIMRGICMRGADARELAPHLLYFAIAPLILTVLSVRRFTQSIMQ